MRSLSFVQGVRYFRLDMSGLKGPLSLLAFLIGAVLIVYLGFVFFGAPTQMPEGNGAAINDSIPGPPPPDVIAALKESRGFEVLISYTDGGFEPREVTIFKGQSIRFTNNSSGNLWVAAVGSAKNPKYPGLSDCGASLFDTCRTLSSREFWEFTFNESGNWAFHNNFDKTRVGIINVNEEQ